MSQELILCAVTDVRVETCDCGRHAYTATRTRLVPSALTSPRRVGGRRLGIVEYDDSTWTVHETECHVFRQPGALKRLFVDLDAPPPGDRRWGWGLVRAVHICLTCQAVSESEVMAWQRQFWGRELPQ